MYPNYIIKKTLNIIKVDNIFSKPGNILDDDFAIFNQV